VSSADYFKGWDWPERREKDWSEHYMDLKTLLDGYLGACMRKDWKLAACYAAEMEPHAWNARMAARKKVAETTPVDML
jgi:hypothetical protein